MEAQIRKGALVQLYDVYRPISVKLGHLRKLIEDVARVQSRSLSYAIRVMVALGWEVVEREGDEGFKRGIALLDRLDADATRRGKKNG